MTQSKMTQTKSHQRQPREMTKLYLPNNYIFEIGDNANPYMRAIALRKLAWLRRSLCNIFCLSVSFQGGDITAKKDI